MTFTRTVVSRIRGWATLHGIGDERGEADTQPADMPLNLYIEDLQDDALERAQLARDLYKRRGSLDFLHQALQARGEAAAYGLVLRRLEAPQQIIPAASSPVFRVAP